MCCYCQVGSSIAWATTVVIEKKRKTLGTVTKKKLSKIATFVVDMMKRKRPAITLLLPLEESCHTTVTNGCWRRRSSTVTHGAEEIKAELLLHDWGELLLLLLLAHDAEKMMLDTAKENLPTLLRSCWSTATAHGVVANELVLDLSS